MGGLRRRVDYSCWVLWTKSVSNGVLGVVIGARSACFHATLVMVIWWPIHNHPSSTGANGEGTAGRTPTAIRLEPSASRCRVWSCDVGDSDTVDEVGHAEMQHHLTLVRHHGRLPERLAADTTHLGGKTRGTAGCYNSMPRSRRQKSTPGGVFLRRRGGGSGVGKAPAPWHR